MVQVRPRSRVIVLDDDPTGSQTVHSCLLLLQWDVETLRLGLRDAAPILFVLTNTRSLPPEAAATVTREVCRNLKQAIVLEGVTDYLVVSRSDSTLRGHYPLETDTIAAALGGFDAHFLVPAFFEGGRITRDSVHYIAAGDRLTPVHQTEFAQDAVFGFQHSYLPDYVAEKTAGKIRAEQVVRFTLGDERSTVLDRLLQLAHNQCCVVDGVCQADLDRFAADLLEAAAQGKRWLLRSAASLLTALADLPPQPVAPEAMANYVRAGQPGVVLVGSHVQKTTEQLQHLLQADGVQGVELDVARLCGGDVSAAHSQMLAAVWEQVTQAHRSGKTAAIYTSRSVLEFEDAADRLQFGVNVSNLLVDVVRHLPATIGFLLSKGGITSNDTLSQALALRSVRLLGQVIPGVSIVRTAPDHDLFPQLPVVLFPGNVGDKTALTMVYRRLSRM